MGNRKISWGKLTDTIFLALPAGIGLLYSKFILGDPYLARLVPFVLMGLFGAGHSYVAWIYLWNQKGPTIYPLTAMAKIGGGSVLCFALILLINPEMAWGLVFYLLSAHFIWQFKKIGQLLGTPPLAGHLFLILLTLLFLAYHCMPFNELSPEGAVPFEALFPYHHWITQGSTLIIAAFLLWSAILWSKKQMPAVALLYFSATIISIAMTLFSNRPWALAFFAIIFAHTVSYFYLQFFALKRHLVFLRQSAWRTGAFLFFCAGITGGMDYWLAEINLEIGQESQEWFLASWEILVKSVYLSVASLHFFLDYHLWKNGILALPQTSTST